MPPNRQQQTKWCFMVRKMSAPKFVAVFWNLYDDDAAGRLTPMVIAVMPAFLVGNCAAGLYSLTASVE